VQSNRCEPIHEGTKFDTGLTAFTVVNQSIPDFILAILLIVIFGFNLGWFPTSGRYAFTDVTPVANFPFMISVIKHPTLPTLSGFIAGFGGGLAFRVNRIREKRKEYARNAQVRVSVRIELRSDTSGAIHFCRFTQG